MLSLAVAIIVSIVSPFWTSDSIEFTEEGYLVEGDMLYRENPYVRITLKDKQWPNATVYYQFENIDDYDEEDVELIQEAMKYIEEKSCVKFVKRTNQPHFVQIRALQGCKAEVGYLAVVRQQLILDTPFCMTKGVIIHELMHILGFVHEQSRADRDKYITIHFDNIKKEKLDNYEMSSNEKTDHFGEAYDAKSVMHYQWNDFAIDKSKPTISSKIASIKSEKFGEAKQNGELSATDIRKLKKYYKCADKR